MVTPFQKGLDKIMDEQMKKVADKFEKHQPLEGEHQIPEEMLKGVFQHSGIADLAGQLEDATKQIAEKNEYIKSLKLAVEYYKGECIPVWHSPEEVPPVTLYDFKEYWIAVELLRTRVIDGKRKRVKEITVFPAFYVNKPLIYNEWEQVEDEEPFFDTSGEEVEAIGWHKCREHEEFDGFYAKFYFTDEYRLLGWAEYKKPAFTGITNER